MILKKSVLNPYVWIVIGYLISITILSKVFMYLFYATGVGQGSVVYKGFTDFLSNETKLNSFIIFFIQTLKFIIVLWLVYKTNLFTVRKIDIKKKDFLYSGICLILKAVISALSVAIVSYIGLETNSYTPNQAKFDEFFQQYIILGIIYSVVCAPIIEEFVFRKVLLGYIFQNYKHVGLAVSSCLFGCLHLVAGFSLTGLIMYVLMGYVFGYVYLKSGRIETTIVMHMINNIVTLLLINVA